jgi:hypothetical protein
LSAEGVSRVGAMERVLLCFSRENHFFINRMDEGPPAKRDRVSGGCPKRMGSFAYHNLSGDPRNKPRPSEKVPPLQLHTALSAPPDPRGDLAKHGGEPQGQGSPSPACLTWGTDGPRDLEDHRTTRAKARCMAAFASPWALAFLNAFHAPGGITPSTLDSQEWPSDDETLTAALNEGVARHESTKAPSGKLPAAGPTAPPAHSPSAPQAALCGYAQWLSMLDENLYGLACKPITETPTTKTNARGLFYQCFQCNSVKSLASFKKYPCSSVARPAWWTGPTAEEWKNATNSTALSHQEKTELGTKWPRARLSFDKCTDEGTTSIEPPRSAVLSRPRPSTAPACRTPEELTSPLPSPPLPSPPSPCSFLLLCQP